MSRTILKGVNGTNPLGFLAAMGLLQLMQRKSESARLGFLSDGTFRAFVEGFDDDLAELVYTNAATTSEKPIWLLEYEKSEKRGTKKVADLKSTSV